MRVIVPFLFIVTFTFAEKVEFKVQLESPKGLQSSPMVINTDPDTQSITIQIDDTADSFGGNTVIDFESGYSAIRVGVGCVITNVSDSADFEETAKELTKFPASGPKIEPSACMFRMFTGDVSQLGPRIDDMCNPSSVIIMLDVCMRATPSSNVDAQPLSPFFETLKTCYITGYVYTEDDGILTCIKAGLTEEDVFEGIVKLGGEEGVEALVTGLVFQQEETVILYYVATFEKYYSGTGFIDFTNNVTAMANLDSKSCVFSNLPEGFNLQKATLEENSALAAYVVPAVTCEFQTSMQIDQFSQSELLMRTCTGQSNYFIRRCELIPEEEIEEDIQCHFAGLLFDENGKGEAICITNLPQK